ncbi:MAG TPA: GerMN domain-containing protein [Actinomycetota bacterium]
MKRVAILALALAACGEPAVTVVPEADLPQDVFGSPRPEALTELPDSTIVYFVLNGRLIAVPRQLPAEAPSLPAAAVEALLQGPSSPWRTAIPEGTRVLSVEVDGIVATVDLTDEFERSAPGHRPALRVAQVVYTLTETPPVEAVRFRIEGSPADVLTGRDEVVPGSVTRANYQRFAPLEEDESGEAA